MKGGAGGKTTARESPNRARVIAATIEAPGPGRVTRQDARPRSSSARASLTRSASPSRWSNARPGHSRHARFRRARNARLGRSIRRDARRLARRRRLARARSKRSTRVEGWLSHSRTGDSPDSCSRSQDLFRDRLRRPRLFRFAPMRVPPRRPALGRTDADPGTLFRQFWNVHDRGPSPAGQWPRWRKSCILFGCTTNDNRAHSLPRIPFP